MAISSLVTRSMRRRLPYCWRMALTLRSPLRMVKLHYS